MIIECRRIENSSNTLLEKVERTYNDSFPKAERRAFFLVRKLIDSERRFSVSALVRDSEYVGFITAWSFSCFTYIEHFAIDPSARNEGIGGKAMREFIASCPTPIVLEVEMPTDEMSVRRIGFYERLGFTLDDHIYFQPPYRKGGHSLEMRLMTHGSLDCSFDEARRNLYQHVYGVDDIKKGEAKF